MCWPRLVLFLAAVGQTTTEEQPAAGSVAAPGSAELSEAPQAVACYDAAEFVVKVANAPFQNPFTEAEDSSGVSCGGWPAGRCSGLCRCG